jgi:hypothetical protein
MSLAEDLRNIGSDSDRRLLLALGEDLGLEQQLRASGVELHVAELDGRAEGTSL